MEIIYQNLKIILPYDVLEINNLCLKEEVNNHHILNIKALIDESRRISK